MKKCRSSAAIFVFLALVFSVMGASTKARATMVVVQPDRVVVITIAKSDRDEVLRAVKVFADKNGYLSEFSPTRYDTHEIGAMLWRSDSKIFFLPASKDNPAWSSDASRLSYVVDVYSMGLEPLPVSVMEKLVDGLRNAAENADTATFTITK